MLCLLINNYNSLTIKDNNLLRETNRIYKDNILPLEENLNDLKFKRREITTEINNYYLLKIYKNTHHLVIQCNLKILRKLLVINHPTVTKIYIKRNNLCQI